jgi:hypothetical protein
MKRVVGFAIIVALFAGACNEAKPTLIGRFNGPEDLAEYKGCPQSSPSCNISTEAHHLLLIINSFENDLRVFDVESRNFFVAKDPLFTLSIPVGELPLSLAVDPLNNFAFVVNAISQDVSLVDLRGNRLVEMDTDADNTTCAPELEIDSPNERCQPGVIGVSRAVLGANVRPEFIVVPRQMPSATGTLQTLPVYVSLIETNTQSGEINGQIAVLGFQYPDSTTTPSTPQKLTLQTPILDIGVAGSIPSGLALTKDGSKLFVADEGKDPKTGEDLKTIHVIDTSTSAITHIDVGGPSRRLALTPDEKTLYVIHSKTPDISVVDVESGTLCVSCTASCVPAPSIAGTIALQNMPRSLTFVKGLTLSVNNTTWAPQGAAVQTFAYVSNLDGNIYLVDAENHCPINSSTTEGEFSYEMFVPSVLMGMASGMISDNFSSEIGTNDFRIFLLFEGADAMMEFFPSQLDSTNFILDQ